MRVMISRIGRASIILAILSVICFYPSINATASSEMELIFIDVGQGDSTLIVFPNGKTMLIDAGTTGNVSKVFEVLNARQIEKIDYLVASHAHEDHIDGLIDILEAYEVGRVLDTGKGTKESIYDIFMLEVKKRNIPIEIVRENFVMELGPVKVEVLSPAAPLPIDLDDASMVISVEYGAFSAIFTGDIGTAIEYELLKKEKAHPVTILKVAHHGSISSSSEAFLNKTIPQYAVISVGNDNGYGHPSAFILTRLSIVGSIALRTDINGNVSFKTNGITTSVAVEKGAIPVVQKSIAVQIRYVASKNSEVFHYSSCESVRAIKPANLIDFSSREQAVASGRRPCSICKP